ncbi:MAG: hypothetical protein MI919_29640 [Holophagales bacterium]|nr:hypothetical protein [Holophagales bacterium]
MAVPRRHGRGETGADFSQERTVLAASWVERGKERFGSGVGMVGTSRDLGRVLRGSRLARLGSRGSVRERPGAGALTLLSHGKSRKHATLREPRSAVRPPDGRIHGRGGCSALGCAAMTL